MLMNHYDMEGRKSWDKVFATGLLNELHGYLGSHSKVRVSCHQVPNIPLEFAYGGIQFWLFQPNKNVRIVNIRPLQVWWQIKHTLQWFKNDGVLPELIQALPPQGDKRCQ